MVTTTEIQETAEVKPTTCTVNEFALGDLLTNLARTADEDPTMPSMHGVLLHTADQDGTSVLVATSSNRYVAAQGHLSCSGELPGPVFLSLPHVKAIEQHLATTRNEYGSSVCQECGRRGDCERCDRHDYVPPRMVELVLSPKGTRLAVRVVPAQGNRAEGVSVTVPVEKSGMFPANVVDMLAKPDSAEAVPGPVILNPDYVRALAMIPSRFESMHLTGYGPGNPVLVQIGDHYRAVVMPMRGRHDLAPVISPVPTPLSES